MRYKYKLTATSGEATFSSVVYSEKQMDFEDVSYWHQDCVSRWIKEYGIKHFDAWAITYKGY